MVNTITIIGRITNEPEIKELDDGKKVSNITLAIPRNYKNHDGIYETDFIDCTVWNNIAINVVEYCKKGDLIGVRGRVETKLYEQDNKKIKDTHVIAEKVTFLSSRNIEKNNDDIAR